MNDTYSSYLLSEAWLEKREQKFSQRGRKCEACGSSTNIQVHHLTYARIFQEEMDDLMVLCRTHHNAAEELVEKGIISRKGDVRLLAERTLKFIAPTKKRISVRVKVEVSSDPDWSVPRATKKARNAKRSARGWRLREEMKNDPGFTPLLEIKSRCKFKKAMREYFKNHAKKGRMMTNAAMLYDSIHKK